MIVEDADRLGERTGNTLLKAIEEPTPKTVWLLCAPTVEDVLPTIRSRCRHVSLATPTAREVARFLVERHGISESGAAFAARAWNAVQPETRSDLVNEEVRDRLLDVAHRSTPESNIRRIDAIFTAREQMMEFNTPPLLALESMMVALRIT